MFKQPLSFNSVRFPAIKTMDYGQLKDPQVLKAVSVLQINQYLQEDRTRKSLLTMLGLAKVRSSNQKFKHPYNLPASLKYANLLFGSIKMKIKALNDKSLQELFNPIIKSEKDVVLLTSAGELDSCKTVSKFSAMKKKLAINNLPSYNLPTTVDELIAAQSKNNTESTEIFLNGIKGSYNYTRKDISFFILNKLMRNVKAVEVPEEIVNINGETETKINYKFEYEKRVHVNAINEEIFINNDLFNLFKVFVTFAPIEHLEILSMYFQENMTKTFQTEKKLNLLMHLLRRLKQEQFTVYQCLDPIKKLNKENKIKLGKSTNVLSKHDLSEIYRDLFLSRRFKLGLVSSILNNPDLEISFVSDLLESNNILTKQDIIENKKLFREKLPNLVEKVAEQKNSDAMQEFIDADDIEISAHQEFVKSLGDRAIVN